MSALQAPAHDPQVDAQLKRIVSLLQAEGRADAATELLTRYGAPPKAKPALFVAGEDKRGKSCLVNALLGRADLSPVGVEVVTAAPITFFASPTPAAHVFRYGNPMPQLEDFDHARSLATVAGNPRNQENIRSVGLGVDSPILEHLNLIDTPGVGGLDSGHATLTLQSLQSADALLFVSEAAAQFRAEELSFLRRAAARVDTVILVLTKIDLHRGWHEVLADDLAILKEQATRFADCPVVPVSSVLALRGLAAEDPADAQLMREESGLLRLEQAINEHVVARASTLRDANVLRQGLGSLAAVELNLRETLAASGPDAAPRQALEDERARLQQLQKDRTLGLQTLDAEIRKLTLERSEAASRATVEIRRAYEERLRDVKKKEFDELPGELVADLTALAARLNEEASNRLTELVAKLIGDLDSAAPLSETIHAVTAAGLQQDLEATPMGEHSLSGYDKVSVVSSFSTGHSLSALTGILASALIAPPFGLILGFGLGGMFAFQAFVSRDQQHFVQAFSSWMTAQISQATLTVNTTFQRQMIDLQGQMRDSVQQALAQREQEIATALHNAEGVLQSATAKQAQTTAQMRGRLEAVAQARAATLTLLQSLSTGDLAAVPGAAVPAGTAHPSIFAALAPIVGGPPRAALAATPRPTTATPSAAPAPIAPAPVPIAPAPIAPAPTPAGPAPAAATPTPPASAPAAATPTPPAPAPAAATPTPAAPAAPAAATPTPPAPPAPAPATPTPAAPAAPPAAATPAAAPAPPAAADAANGQASPPPVAPSPSPAPAPAAPESRPATAS